MSRHLRNSIIIFLLVVGKFDFFFSQEVISSSRPGQCIGSRTIDKGILQFQNGIQYDFGDVENIQIPGVLIRYGLLNHLEFRIGESLNRSNKNWAFASPVVSVLFDVSKENDFLPQMVISLYSTTGLFDTPINSGIKLSGSNSITEKLGYSFVFGGDYSTDFVANYVVGMNYSFNNFTPFFEVYGDVVKNGMKFDTGIAYLITNDLQLDIYGGSDFVFEHFFISTGISFRLNK